MGEPSFLAFFKSRCPGLARAGGEWRCKCPIHGGERDSFSVDPDTGRWRCHSKCDEGGDAYRLEERLTGLPFPQAKVAVDQFQGVAPMEPPTPRAGGKPWETVVATYDYRDADGVLVYQVTRHEPKDFRQRRPDPDAPGRWKWSIKGITPLLYRLPELLADVEAVIYIAEGEKDVDALRGLGLVATCNSGGAGKFTADMAKAIAGRRAVILPDRDEPGRKHAHQVATQLVLQGCRVKVLELPAGKDPADWVAAGGTADDLRELQRTTPEWGAPARRPEPMPELAGDLDDEALFARADDEADGAPGLPVSIRDMLKTYIIVVGTSDVFDRRRWRFIGRDQVRHAHELVYTAWAKDPEVVKMDADRIGFWPKGGPSGGLNLFRGLPLQPDGAKPHRLIVDHLAHLMGHQEQVLHWVTCWLAYPLQHVGAKLQTALVVHGQPGTGKSLLFEHVMGRIYGDYSRVVGPWEIDSRWTGWASQKLFVVADEVVANRKDARAAGRLKMMVTGPQVTIEQKGLDPRLEANHMNLVFLSNSDHPVMVDVGDRRYMVVRCDELRGEDDLADLWAEIAADGAAGFLDYLLSYDLKGWQPHEWPIATDAKAELTAACTDSMERFFKAWATDELPVPFGCAITTDLFEAYRIWCVAAGERREQANLEEFGARVAKRWARARHTIGGRKLTCAVVGDWEPLQAANFKNELDDWMKAQLARTIR
jgi:hypothetical protein